MTLISGGSVGGTKALVGGVQTLTDDVHGHKNLFVQADALTIANPTVLRKRVTIICPKDKVVGRDQLTAHTVEIFENVDDMLTKIKDMDKQDQFKILEHYRQFARPKECDVMEALAELCTDDTLVSSLSDKKRASIFETLYGLGDLYCQENNPVGKLARDAHILLQAALKLKPLDESAKNALANVKIFTAIDYKDSKVEGKNASDARQLLEEVIALAPTAQGVKDNLSVACRALAQIHDVPDLTIAQRVQLLKAAYAFLPNDEVLRDAFEKRSEEAIAFYEASLRVKPDDAVVQGDLFLLCCNVADTYIAGNGVEQDLDRAGALLRTAGQLKPTSDLYRILAAKLEYERAA